MLKLLIAYRAAPSLKLAQKIRAYGHKHPFSSCLLLSHVEADLLADAIHHANLGHLPAEREPRTAAGSLD